MMETRRGRSDISDKTVWTPRLAQIEDVPALNLLIPISVRALQAGHYSKAQMDVAIGPIFGVDRQLIRDQTYFVVEDGERIVGCGGWSRRESLSGSDINRQKEDALLDPRIHSARVRAFFIHPDYARRGIARSIMQECERAIIAAGFRKVEISATLTGESFYKSFGYTTIEHYDLPMASSLKLPVVRMRKAF
jgi:GNAT superfamily N-acetyltransferase